MPDRKYLCPCSDDECDATTRAKTKVSRKCQKYPTEAEAVAAGKEMESGSGPYPCPCSDDECDAKTRAKTMVSRKCQKYPTEAEAEAAGKKMESESGKQSGTRTSGASGKSGKPGASGSKRTAVTGESIKASVAGFMDPRARVAAVVNGLASAVVDVAACLYPKPGGESPAAEQTRMDLCKTLDYVRKKLLGVHWDTEVHQLDTDSPARRESMVPGHPRYNQGDTLLRKLWDSSACECAFYPGAEPTLLFRDVVTEAEDESVKGRDVPETSVLSKTVVRASLDKMVKDCDVVFVQGHTPEIPILEFLGYDEVRVINLQTCMARACQVGKSVAGSDFPIATGAKEMTRLLLNEKFKHRARSDAFHQARLAGLFWPKFYALLKSKLGDILDEILDNYDVEGYKFPRRPAAADGATPCAKKRKAAA